MGFPCIGLPGTIDNDIKGTDYTIGFFTALSTVVEAIDRLRDTSSSHQRISVVEVMGRYCGDLTLAAAIAGGCEFIMVPEVEYTRDDLVAEIKAGIAKGKKHAIVAITEHMCDVDELASYIEKETGRETRATVLGHIQRGGSPVPYDRILASRMGAYAIGAAAAGPWRSLRRHPEREAGAPRHHRCHREHEASVQERLAGLREETVLSYAPDKQKAFSWRRPFLWRKVYSISSGSSDRIIPVLSAYRWSPEKKVTPPKLTRTSLSPMPSPAAPTGIAASA